MTTLDRTTEAPARSAAERLLHPRTILVTGVSERAGTLGRRVLGKVLRSGYAGQVLALGRTATTVDGVEVVTGFDQLPDGIDLALLGVPAAGVADAVRECGAHGIGAVVCYASGYAERGEDGAREQAELARLAEVGGVGLVGPNCFGFASTPDHLSTMMADIPDFPGVGPGTGPGVAVIAQSGSIACYLVSTLGSRNVPISYAVTTGNEVGLDSADLTDYFAADEHTGIVALYAEQIHDPERFLAAIRTAVAAGKAVVLMHPGRSTRAQAAVASHTGAMAGDHAMVTTLARRAGAAVVDSLEELADVSELLLRHHVPPTGGTAMITGSGAICAITNDAAEALGLDLPALTPGIGRELAGALNFTDVTNPLDVGTQLINEPELLRMAAKRMVDDPEIGSILVSLPSSGPGHDAAWLAQVLDGVDGSTKPLIYALQSEEAPPQDFRRLSRERRVVYHNSPERALRALARLTEHGRSRAVRATGPTGCLVLPELVPGPQPEWVGKRVLAAAGVPVPDGGLATSVDEALEIAARIGYPVVAKAQAATLAHKSDVGGVLLDIRDEGALRAAWRRLHETIGAKRPGLTLDGVLVEQLSRPGVEMVIGARRDPRWGAVLLVGLGGVHVEVLNDVRLLAADLPQDAIAAEIERLKGARLLRGFRGTEPVDVEAVAAVAAAVGWLVRADPRITEIDVNPVVAYPQGNGALALDALVVTTEQEQ